MRHALVRVVVTVAMLAGATAACSDTSGPVTSDREYVLRSVYGQPLPLTLYATTAGDTVQLVGESVVLKPGGHATIIKYDRTVIDGGPATYSQSGAAWTYHVVGVRISLRPVCPPNGDLCSIGRSGTLVDTQLRLFEPDDPAEYAWVYDRADFHTTNATP
jgi:hypothetical protein